MKKKLILFLLVAITVSSCATSREGCAGARYQGQKFKSYKFSW